MHAVIKVETSTKQENLNSKFSFHMEDKLVLPKTTENTAVKKDFIRFIMSFQKYIKTANRVARCTTISKAIFGARPKSLWPKTR